MPKKQIHLTFRFPDLGEYGQVLVWDNQCHYGAMIWLNGEDTQGDQLPYLIDSPTMFAQTVIDNHHLMPRTDVITFLRRAYLRNFLPNSWDLKDSSKESAPMDVFESVILDKINLVNLKPAR